MNVKKITITISGDEKSGKTILSNFIKSQIESEFENTFLMTNNGFGPSISELFKGTEIIIIDGEK